MFGKITISRMFAVAMVFGVLMSGTSVYAGQRTETAKTVLRTAAKASALSITGTATVAGALSVFNRGPAIALLALTNFVLGRAGVGGIEMGTKFKVGVAVPTILCGVASYKLAKNLVKSYKARKASASTVNAK